MEKRNKTNKLAFCGVMTALSVLFLLLASVLPGTRIALTAVAGVAAAIVVVQNGVRYGVLIVIATVALAALVVPGKEIVLLYATFFGPYTILKNLIERLHMLPLEWVLKLMFCVSVSALLFLFADQVVDMVPAMFESNIWMFFPAIVAAFVAYDVVFSKLIVYVFVRLHI